DATWRQRIFRGRRQIVLVEQKAGRQATEVDTEIVIEGRMGLQQRRIRAVQRNAISAAISWLNKPCHLAPHPQITTIRRNRNQLDTAQIERDIPGRNIALWDDRQASGCDLIVRPAPIAGGKMALSDGEGAVFVRLYLFAG